MPDETNDGAITSTAVARARPIKLILFDVDGVLTDGTLWFVPGTGPERGENGASRMVETKGFHAHDGIGFALARIAGLKTGLITKRQSEVVAQRGRDLKLDYVLQGAHDKATALLEILGEGGLSGAQTAFVGDDIVDLPAMRLCGLAIAVANARAEVKREAHWTTGRPGGQGAARDAIEFVLRAQNRLDATLEKYLQPGAPAASL